MSTMRRYYLSKHHDMLEAIGLSFRDKVKQPWTPRRIMVNLVLFGLMTGLIGIAGGFW